MDKKPLEKITADKISLNFSSTIENILSEAKSMSLQLSESNNIASNYLSEDLLEYKTVDSEKLNTIMIIYMDNLNMFCQELENISMDKLKQLSEYNMNNLKDMLDIPELTIFRLKNLYDKDLNDQLIEIESMLKNYVHTLIDDNMDIQDKIDYLLQKDNFFKHVLLKYDETINIDIYDNDDNDNNMSEKFDNNNIINKLQQKYDNLIIVENTNNILKWNDDILIYEISTVDCKKKIFIYLDLFERENKEINKKENKIITLDFYNKIYCIIQNNINDNINNIKNLLNTIEYIININFNN